MTHDAFRRLALLAGCSGWVVAVAMVWLYLAWQAGLAAALAGPLLTVVLTLEQPTPAKPAAEREGLSRRQINRGEFEQEAS